MFLLSRFDDYYKLNFGKRPAEELYDIKADADCMVNLAGNLDYAQRMRGLRDRMEKMLREEGDPRMNGRGTFSIRSSTRGQSTTRGRTG